MNDRNRAGSHRSPLTLAGFGLRFVAALCLVLASYNPTPYSVYAWVRGALAVGTLGPEHFLVGVLLLSGWTMFVVASLRSLGALGLALVALFFGGLIWLLVDIGWLRTQSLTSVTWIVLVCLAALLAIGMSWSHIWRRLTGQLEVDDD